jgi:UDP-N-acetylmuramoyl-L-alanyl-D-glutamate--2,6-diaminopimelate ligase
MTVVGVTGTDGKTTTSHMIDALCRASGRRTGLIGTVEVRVGDMVDQHESRQTTPESLHVQGYLAQMRAAEIDVAVVEATSHGLAMHRLDQCAFDVGVVTNITHEHLDFHGSLENYRLAKGELFRMVAASRALGKLGVVVVNRDDPGAGSIEHLAEGCAVLHYTVNEDLSAPIFARNISTAGATTFDLTTPTGTACVRLNLPGWYNVANALAAAGASHALGLSVSQIARGLESLAGVPGRMQMIDTGQPFQVIVDYAHTPEALRHVLSEARRFGEGRLMVLFGSAGERDIAKRAIQGAVAMQLADFAVFTSEDPRFEDADAIIAEIAAGAVGAGGRRGVHFECIEDRRQAISALIGRARAGDVLILAGKGHEHSMIYGDERRPWSDADTARAILREAGYDDQRRDLEVRV